MRIAICEDDERELVALSELIMEYQSGRGAGLECRFFDNSTDFLDEVKSREYDLVLLDVSMRGISGIQAARELREWDKNVRIIFVSSSPEFAVESYSVAAYHYLLKPVDGNALFGLLDKAEKELQEEEEQGFILKSRGSIVRVFFAGIEYVEVINKTVFFHLADGVIYKASAALTDFEERLLVRPEFFKPHRSYLINLQYVRTISDHCIITKSGNSIPISRQRYSLAQDTYMHFMASGRDRGTGLDVQAVSAGRMEHADVPWRILLVDDDPAERTFWADILISHGSVVQVAKNGEEALRLASESAFDCVLLDVMLPGEDGFSICEKLHRMVQTPVIFLSSLTESDKQMEGFAFGGIDYITKDTPAELVWTKVETRIKLANLNQSRLYYGSLLLDLRERRALIGGRELDLTPIEFDILWKLSEKAGHVFTPEEICAMVWGGKFWDGGKKVQSHMSKLRRKLEKACGEHHFIEIVWGQGYRFIP